MDPNPQTNSASKPTPTVETSHVDEPLVAALTWLVGCDVARRVVDATGVVGVTRMSAAELSACANVPFHIAERIVALRYVGTLFLFETRRPLNCPSEVAEVLPPELAHSETELVIAITLDAKHAPKGVVRIAEGGATTATFKARDVFQPLLRLGAVTFIIAHNHPSGDPTPSADDVKLTNILAALGEVLGVPLLDHLVVAGSQIVSLYELGLMPNRVEKEKALLEQLGGTKR